MHTPEMCTNIDPSNDFWGEIASTSANTRQSESEMVMTVFGQS